MSLYRYLDQDPLISLTINNILPYTITDINTASTHDHIPSHEDSNNIQPYSRTVEDINKEIRWIESALRERIQVISSITVFFDYPYSDVKYYYL
jgi:hypothetical protein